MSNTDYRTMAYDILKVWAENNNPELIENKHQYLTEALTGGEESVAYGLMCQHIEPFGHLFYDVNAINDYAVAKLVKGVVTAHVGGDVELEIRKVLARHFETLVPKRLLHTTHNSVVDFKDALAHVFRADAVKLSQRDSLKNINESISDSSMRAIYGVPSSSLLVLIDANGSLYTFDIYTAEVSPLLTPTYA